MAVMMPIHEVKDHLSQVISRLAESGEEVHITKHGRVVARLVAAPSNAVVLGVDSRPGTSAPDLDDLRWTDAELDAMFGGSVMPEPPT